MAMDYSIYSTAASYQQVIRRGFAITFSDKIPEDTDSFNDYIQRHGPTSSGAWSSDLCGFIIHNTINLNSSSYGHLTLRPFAQIVAPDRDGLADDPAIVRNIYESGATGMENELTFAAGDSIEIPEATWLEYKLSTDIHGASGQAHRRHGRFYLTVHHCDGGRDTELIDVQKEDGDFEGPMCLCSTKDDLTVAHGDIDEPLSTNHWLPHMTVWVLNCRNNSGGGFDALGTSIDTTHIHDALSAGALAAPSPVIS